MRKIGKRVVLAALASTFAACAPGAPARETAADSTAIRALGDKFETAWNAGDAAAMAQMVTEDYTASESDGSAIAGRAAYEAMEKTAADARKGAGMVIDIVPGAMAFLTPTTATSTGTWSLKGVPAGGGPDKGSYLVVSVKGADGQWRMRNALAAAFVPPPPAPVAKGK
jgi:uncharacterized protein (TIGR02246 family)